MSTPPPRRRDCHLLRHPRAVPFHRLVITSDAFKTKMQPARHRMVYALLREEMAVEGGIHALQLRTMTPDEEEKQRRRKEAEAPAAGKE